MTTLQVEAAVAGRARAGAPQHELVVTLPAGPTPLGALIEAIVHAEVDAFVQRARDERLVRVLTEKVLSEGLVAGTVRSGGREVGADVDPDTAVLTAIEAQQDGLFQTIVDDQPVDDLGTVLEVHDGTRVMFLRLVPLAGG